LLQPILQAEIAVEVRRRFELDQQVNVAVRAKFVTRCRAEQPELANTEALREQGTIGRQLGEDRGAVPGLRLSL
jgi:hypothetical protein